MLIFALFALVVAGLATSLVRASDAVAVAVFPILWVLGLVLATAGRPNKERRTLGRLFTLSFLLRIAVAIVIYRFGLVYLLGDEDGSGWVAGWGIAQAWRGDFQFTPVRPDFLLALHQSNQGYYYLAGAFLYLIGAPSRLALAMLSALAGALTVVLIYRIGDQLFGRAAAEKAGLWTAVFPSLVVWSAQTLKEPFVILCECAVVYAVIVLRTRPSPKLVLLLLVSLFCLYTMRFYAAYLSAAAAVLVLAIPTGDRRGATPLAAAMVLSAAVAGLFASGLWHVDVERFNQFNLAWIKSFRIDVATGEGSGSGILLPYDVSTPEGAALSFPASLASFLLSPYPWQVAEGSMRLKLSFVDVLLWWWMIPKVVAGLRGAWRMQRGSVGPLMLFIGPLTVFYTLTFGNAGLAYRERAQILVLLIVFAGLGFACRSRRAPLNAADS